MSEETVEEGGRLRAYRRLAAERFGHLIFREQRPMSPEKKAHTEDGPTAQWLARQRAENLAKEERNGDPGRE